MAKQLTKKIGGQIIVMSDEIGKIINQSKSKILSILSSDKRANSINSLSIKIEKVFNDHKYFWTLGMNAQQLAKYVVSDKDKKYLYDLSEKLSKSYKII